MADPAPNGRQAQDLRAAIGAHPEQSRSIERRSQVLAAAVRLLLRGQGTSGFTHRSVAAEAGASLSAIRYYFRTRDDLLAACLDELEKVRSTEAARVLDQAIAQPPADAETTAWAAMRVYYGPDLNDPSITGLVWCIMDCSRQSPELSVLLGTHRQQAIDQLAQLLSICGRAEISPTLAPAILDGSVMTSAVESKQGVTDLAVSELARFLRLTEQQTTR